MKIVTVAHYYTPHVGGLEVVAEMLVKSLVDVGHDVTVLTCASTEERAGVDISGGATVKRFKSLNFTDRMFGIPFPIPGIGFFTALRKEIKQANAVHVHDVFYMPCWLAAILAFVYKRPLILTQHVPFVPHPSRLVMLVQKVVYGTWGRFIFSYAKNIIVYNPQVRDFLVGRGVAAEKIVHTRNGIYIDLFSRKEGFNIVEKKLSLGLPVDRPIVLFVGRMVPKKGYRELFEARDDSFELVYVGSGEVDESWKHTPHFHFLGPKSQAELAELYHLADIFVFPARGEMFTLVMQEAMASGLPIITSNEPGYAEFDIDRELLILCEPKPSELKLNILRVLNDRSLKERMGAYAKQLSQLFDWNHNVQPVLSLYDQISNERSVVVTTSWDDGHVLDFKLAELLNKYGIKGTFYIAPEDHESPVQERLTESEIQALASQFEIGAHTIKHFRLPNLTLAAAEAEIFDSKKYLEELLGRPITSFCYPAGKYVKEHVEMVKRAGFSYARTVKRFFYATPTNVLEAATSVHTYDHWLDIWGLARLVSFNPFTFFRAYRKWDVQAKLMFDKVEREGGVFHLWGHSWEVDEHNDWERLESVLAYIGNRNTVRYVTNGQLVEQTTNIAVDEATKTVLVATPYYPPHPGGLERYVAEITARFSLKPTWNLVIVTTGEKGTQDHIEQVHGVTVYRLSPSIIISNTPFAFSWFGKIKKLVKAIQPDLVHVHMPVPGLADVVAHQINKEVPLIVTYHAGSMKKGKWLLDRVIGLYEGVFLRKILKRADHIVCVSNDVHNDFLNKYSYKSSVIMPAVDGSLFVSDEAKRATTPTVLFVGALGRAEQYKNLSVVLKAMEQVCQAVPNARLVVVGEGDMRGEYEAEAVSLGIGSQVEFTGKLEGAALVKRYQSAHAFVVASEKESFGMVAIEAHACGVPVVATPVGALQTIVEDGVSGFIVPLNDVEATAERLQYLLTHPIVAIAMGKRGEKTAHELYSWEDRVQQYEELYQKTLDGSPLIVQIGAYYPPFIGGIEKVIETTASMLSKGGESVRVITASGSKEHSVTQSGSLEVRRLATTNFANVPFAFGLFKELSQLPRKSLIHIHLSQAFWPEVTMLMAKMRRIPYIAHFHLDISPSSRFGLLFVLYKKLVWGPFLRNAAEVIVCSEAQIPIVVEKYGVDGDKVHAIQNAVSESFFIPHTVSTGSAGLRLLYVGRLAPQKRVDRIIDALPLLSVPCTLTIVGDGESREELENLVNSYELQNVSFVGAMDESGIKQQFMSHDVLIMSSDKEGMPLVALEAMAAGLPIIATNVIGLRELVGGTGVLVDAPYAEGIASAIIELADSSETRESLSQQSVAKARQFDWTRYYKKLQPVYQVALSPIRSTRSALMMVAGLMLWWASFALLSTVHNEYLAMLQVVIGAPFLMIVLGYMTARILKLQFTSVTAMLLISSGFSLLGLMVGGLLLNTFLPLVGIAEPLSGKVPILAVSTLFLMLLVPFYRSERVLSRFSFKFPTISTDTIAIVLFALIILTFSVFGALQLNAGHTNSLNILALISMVLAGAFILTTPKLGHNTVSFVVYCISLSLLLMTSLRGEGIIGHDIQREFAVFELTKHYGFWAMEHYRDAYNACLSITILPVILKNTLQIADAYIYKILAQLVFALVPVAVFLIAQQWLSRNLALLATVFFISFPTFFSDMPFLVRQEYAFFFFGLLLLVWFGKPIRGRVPQWVPILFGVGMILSHYSTTYTAIALVGFVLGVRLCASIILPLFKRWVPKHSGVALLPSNEVFQQKHITWFFLFVLIFCSYLWSGTITQSASNSLSRVVANTINELQLSNWSGRQSTDTQLSLFSKEGQTQQELFAEYQERIVAAARAEAPEGAFYDEDIVSAFPVMVLPQEKTPLTTVGALVESWGVDVSGAHAAARNIIAKVLQLLVIIGLAVVLFRNQAVRKILPIELYLFGVANLLMVALIVILPLLSIEYGVLRAFQQGLMVLGIFMVIGVVSLAPAKFEAWAKGALVVITLIVFTFSVGLMGRLTGGTDPKLYHSNAGSYYDLYYLEPAEIDGLRWLAGEIGRTNGEVQSERQIDPMIYGEMTSIVDSNPLNTIYPGLIRTDSYVFLTPRNANQAKAIVIYKDTYITYTYPVEFLDTVKEVVYDEGGVKIYR